MVGMVFSNGTWVVTHFDCGTRILRVNHGPEARATFEIESLPGRARGCVPLGCPLQSGGHKDSNFLAT